MDEFQDPFRAADTDRINNSTTRQSGYHGPIVNHISDIIPPKDDAISITSIHTNKTIAAKDAQIERLLVAMQSRCQANKTQAPGSVFSTITAATSQTDVATSYCWMHGQSKNLQHNSTTCKKKAEGHQEAATATNTQGGSAQHWGHPPAP